MTRTSCACRPCQRGMGLVELMVGMTVGLILLAALGYFFLGSRQASRTHDDISRIQESGRHALEILGTAIRQAGYRSDADVPFAGTALTGTDGTPDTITVQFDAQPGGEADCAGGPPNASGQIEYAFTVNDSLQLTCNGQPAVDHIENMQVEYGIDANKDGQIEEYVDAPTAAQFLAVAAVRVTLTVRGPTPNAATGGDGFLRQTYTTTYTVRNQAW